MVEGVFRGLQQGLKPIELFIDVALQRKLLRVAGRTSLQNQLFILCAGLIQFYWFRFLLQGAHGVPVKYIFTASLFGGLVQSSDHVKNAADTSKAVLDYVRFATSIKTDLSATM